MARDVRPFPLSDTSARGRVAFDVLLRHWLLLYLLDLLLKPRPEVRARELRRAARDQSPGVEGVARRFPDVLPAPLRDSGDQV